MPWLPPRTRNLVPVHRGGFHHGLISFGFRLIIGGMNPKWIVAYIAAALGLLLLLAIITSDGSWELGYL